LLGLPDCFTLKSVYRAADLLAAYDEQLRGRAESDPSVETDSDGPLVRVHYRHRGFVGYRSLEGQSDQQLDALIDRQIAHFAERGQAFEWKTRGHDWPSDLPERLRARGFEPEPRETVLIGVAAQLATDLVLPDGITLRSVWADEDMRRVAAMESSVWGEDWSWLADELIGLVAGGHTEVLAAEADEEVVSAGWIVYKPGTDFAGIWGGSTLKAWRGRGIYRTLVARRAQLAVGLGYRFLQVDASDDSRPILERLGFVAVTTTTPYVWTPLAGP
jgi:GNAT superfamily N-acetyltransferase